MKKLLCFSALAVLVISACNLADITGNDVILDDDAEMGVVTFSLSGNDDPLVTKSSSQAAESAVRSLQVLVFNSGGNLVSYASSTSNAVSASVPLNINGHKVFAVTNVSEDLSSCSSPSALTSRISYLKDNSLEALQMIGSVDNQTFTSGSTVPVEVRRFASKVEIDEIVSAFTAAAHKSQEFKIKGIYLINVNGSSPYTQVSTPGVWYNQLQYVSGDCNSLISDIFQAPVTVQTSSGAVTSYKTKHYFYCYSNPASVDTHGGTFSPRRTRLVIETVLGSTTYYYPIDIVGNGNTLDPNTSYTVTKLTITGPGVEHPDDPLNTGSVSFNVTVKNWDTGFSKTVTY